MLSKIVVVSEESVPGQEPSEILFMLFVRSVDLHSMACKWCSLSHCWSCGGAVFLSQPGTKVSKSTQCQCSELNSTIAANIL